MYKLLLVDDEAMAAEHLKQTFDWEKYGFTTVEVLYSGEDAIDYIKENPVDALITDIKMPDVSGIELAKFCYENYPNIGVVLYTAYRDFEYAQQGIRYNVVDYLIKPVNDEELITCLEKLNKHLLNIQQVIERPAPFSHNMIIQEVIAYVNEHYSENITAEDVAKHVLISPRYFSAYFKKSYGKNFIEFLREVRMSAAVNLLKNENLSIAAVAEMVGYKSIAHFYDSFQNYSGQTPAQYRKAVLGIGASGAAKE